MRFTNRLVFVVAAVSATSAFGQATRVDRLSGLCQLWGRVKYLHPGIPGHLKDWDNALLRAIPKVDAASTNDAYRAALNEMLATLGDPATTVRSGMPTPPKVSRDSGDQPRLEKHGKTAIIVATDFEKVLKSGKSLRALAREAATAEEVVLDIRNLGGATRATIQGFPGAYSDPGFIQMLPVLLSATLERPSILHQWHHGYASQIDTGGLTSSGDTYWSSLQMRAQSGIRPLAAEKKPRQLTVLVNALSPDISNYLIGLQSQGIANVILEGEPTGFEANTVSVNLPEGMVASVRNRWSVIGGRAKDFKPDLVLPVAESADVARKRAVGFRTKSKTVPGRPITETPSFAESEYLDQAYPSREMRLLSLFRYWNVIDNFFPYKRMMSRPWGTALPAFIPKFEAAKNEEEYALTVCEIAAWLDDSHGTVNAKSLAKSLTGPVPPLQVSMIEGKPTIMNVRDEALKAKGIAVGDVIETVDGQPVESRIAWIKDRVAASNPGVKDRKAATHLLSGEARSMCKISVRKADGSTQSYEVERGPAAMPSPPAELPATFRVLPSGYGYVDLGRLRFGEGKAAYDAIKNTPGLVLDMRGYPIGGSFEFARYLASRTSNGAKVVFPVLDGYAGRGRTSLEEQFAFADKNFGYKGKIVILVAETTQSAAEHTCLHLEAGNDVTYVGYYSSGANGNITYTNLPGGVQVMFTGMEIQHGDGRQLQRVGLQPQILVRPTLAGVRGGRDEVLERAVEFLSGKNP